MIRAARDAEAGTLARLEFRAWVRARADDVDPERFATLEERTDRWGELLAEPGHTLVFDQDGVVAGFTSFGPARDDDLGPSVGELRALYVDPPAQGAGVGGTLLDTAGEHLRADAFTTAVLWVLADADHARHVCERRGWALDGRTREELWTPEVRYRRAL